MTQDTRLVNIYFHWITNLVCYDQYRSKKAAYRKLLGYLFERDFKTFIIENDRNRAIDGIGLRKQFGDHFGYSPDVIDTYISGECSVLEMMIALAVRCETHIMSGSSDKNRTAKWFWGMIQSLGLIRETDEHYREDHVEMVIDRLINRDYRSDGKGGLFTVKNSRKDLTDVEIWYQMCWYISSIM